MSSSSTRLLAFALFAACLAACSTAPVASLDLVPRVVNRVFPEYPAIARREGIEGKVTVLIYVNERGVVERIEPKSSPHQALTLAAIDAFLQWRFETPVENGRRIPFVVEYSMEFHLTDPALA
jgi:TonB family protein